MATHETQFLFAACQRGAESALKHEIAMREPDYRFAYSRPGFVTFKLPPAAALPEVFLRRWTFARTHGISIGKVGGDHLHRLAERAWSVVGEWGIDPCHDVHVWQRDTDTPGRHHFEPGPTALTAQIEQAVRGTAPAGARLSQAVAPEVRRPTGRNRCVFDVVVVEPNEWWLGWHQVALPQHRWPGGVMPVARETPPISRAFLKMEEALAWAALPIREGDEWVELGCAPGGASEALLARGQFVTGIDPAEVDAGLMDHPRFRHLRKRVAEVRRREFLDVNWLAADLNVAPQYTLDAVEAVVTSRTANLRGLLITLKLPQWHLASQIPDHLQRIRSWGYHDVRVRQLAYNAQEVCVAALRRRAQRRLRRGTGRANRSYRGDASHVSPGPPHIKTTADS